MLSSSIVFLVFFFFLHVFLKAASTVFLPGRVLYNKDWLNLIALMLACQAMGVHNYTKIMLYINILAIIIIVNSQ